MSDNRSAALVVSPRLFEMASWSEEDERATSRARLTPLIALCGGRAALGPAAQQAFALDETDLVADPLTWLSGNRAPPRAFADTTPELWCAALFRQLREEAGAAGADGRGPCTLALPDMLIGCAERLTVAGAVAGMAIDRCVPFSLAVALAAHRGEAGARLICVVDDTAATLTVVAPDGETLTRADGESIAGLGGAAVNAAATAVVEEALRGDAIEVTQRRTTRILLATRSLLPALLGDGVTTMLELDIGDRLRQICLTPAEIERRTAPAATAFVAAARRLARALPDDAAAPILLAAERHDLPRVRRLLTEAIPGARIACVGLDTIATGAIRAAPSRREPAVAAVESPTERTLVGLVETVDGVTRFDVLFGPFDPRARAPRRLLSFPGEARVALFRPDVADGFERIGEVHFPSFDFQGGEFDLWFSRTGDDRYSIRCHERATGQTETKTMDVAADPTTASLAGMLSALAMIPPLPPLGAY